MSPWKMNYVARLDVAMDIVGFMELLQAGANVEESLQAHIT